MFTRKHFKEVARIFSETPLRELNKQSSECIHAQIAFRDALINRFVDMFTASNPRFDVERFRDACIHLDN
jgi:hypothetical protein